MLNLPFEITISVYMRIKIQYFLFMAILLSIGCKQSNKMDWEIESLLSHKVEIPEYSEEFFILIKISIMDLKRQS